MVRKSSFALALIFIPVFCFGRDIPSRNNSEVNDAEGWPVAMSRAHIPTASQEPAKARTERFLKFFRTSTVQLMPTIFYGMCEDIRDVNKLKQLQSRGVLLFLYQNSQQPVEDTQRLLEIARQAGVGGLVVLPRDYLYTKDRTFWEKYISKLADNKQILTWYLPEEIETKNLYKEAMLSDIVRRLDTGNRPLITYAQHHSAEHLSQLNNIVDAVVFGDYPSFYEEPRTRIVIKRRIDTAYERGAFVVLAALESIKGPHKWTSPKDVRFDAYLSLISGAKGIMWWSYNRAKPRPQLMEAVLNVAEELNGPLHLGEVLLSGKEPELLECRHLEGPKYSYGETISSLQWAAREYKGYLYIFAVNSAQQLGQADDGGAEYRIKARFGHIKTLSDEAEVINEGRKIALSSGYFSDSFEPLGTHIYRIKLD